MSRVSERIRSTRETSISLCLNLDGTGETNVSTGIGFLDHMLTILAFHAHFDLDLQCTGDLQIDDHHTAEDCAIALGEAINDALGERTGIQRFATAHAPLEESLARVVVDLAARPCAEIDLGLTRERLGTLACENVEHVFISLAMNARITMHVDVLRGRNDHHRAECAFKALALALREAVAVTQTSVASTKGAL